MAFVLVVAIAFSLQGSGGSDSEGPREALGRDASIRSMLDDQILNARSGLGVNRDALDEALQRLAAVEIPSSRAERRELAALWKAAAEAVRESDGTTELLLDLLRTASNLDPEDERLAAEVAYQAERRRIVAARLEAAARERARRDSETLN